MLGSKKMLVFGFLITNNKILLLGSATESTPPRGCIDMSRRGINE